MSDTLYYTTAMFGRSLERRFRPEPKFFWELHVVVGGNPTGEEITGLTNSSDYLVGEVPTAGTVFPMAFAVAPGTSGGFAAAPQVSVYASDGTTLLFQGGNSLLKAPFDVPAGSKIAFRPIDGSMPAFQPVYLPLWL